MKKEDILKLQSFLLSSGFDPGPIDGIWGPRSRSALRAACGTPEPVVADYIHGIDVSGYQGRINWKKCAESGLCSFAIVKISEGSSHRQKSAQRNLDGAREQSVPVAGYHYAHPNTGSGLKDAEWEAKNFSSHYQMQPGDMIPWVDFESGGLKEASKHEYNVRWLIRYIETVKKETGCPTVGIYTARWAISSRLRHADNLSELAQFPLWFAEYRSEHTKEPRKKMSPWKQGGQKIWQWTGHGKVPGIRGDCDRNKATAKAIEGLKVHA